MKETIKEFERGMLEKENEQRIIQKGKGYADIQIQK